MANKYCNLPGSEKISDTYTDINDGFAIVEDDVKNANTGISEVNTELITHKTAPTLNHPAGSVKSTHIGNDEVKTDNISNNAITEPKIADGAVSDRAIGNRTIQNPETATGTKTGTLTALLNSIVAGIRSGATALNVLKTTYASISQAGLIKLHSGNNQNRSGLVVSATDGTAYVNTKEDVGTSRHGDGSIGIVRATEDEIAGQASSYKPIVPATLDFAVQSIAGKFSGLETVNKTNLVSAINELLNGLTSTYQNLQAHKTATTMDHPAGSVKSTHLADGIVTSGKIAQSFKDDLFQNNTIMSTYDVDLNIFTKSGVYGVACSNVSDPPKYYNFPSNDYFAGSLIVTPCFDFISQIFVTEGNSDNQKTNKMFIRTLGHDGYAEKDWQEVGDIANGSITGDKIATDTVTGGVNGNIAQETIDDANIVLGSITGGEYGCIGAKEITGYNIADKTITSDKIGGGAIRGGMFGNIMDKTIEAINIADETIDKTKVTVDFFDGVGKMAIATSTTASTVANKIVTTEKGDFKLENGATVFVKFLNVDATVVSKTLNIDGTGAYDVYYNYIDVAEESLKDSQAFVFDSDIGGYVLLAGFAYNEQSLVDHLPDYFIKANMLEDDGLCGYQEHHKSITGQDIDCYPIAGTNNQLYIDIDGYLWHHHPANGYITPYLNADIALSFDNKDLNTLTICNATPVSVYSENPTLHHYPKGENCGQVTMWSTVDGTWQQFIGVECIYQRQSDYTDSYNWNVVGGVSGSYANFVDDGGQDNYAHETSIRGNFKDLDNYMIRRNSNGDFCHYLNTDRQPGWVDKDLIDIVKTYMFGFWDCTSTTPTLHHYPDGENCGTLMCFRASIDPLYVFISDTGKMYSAHQPDSSGWDGKWTRMDGQIDEVVNTASTAVTVSTKANTVYKYNTLTSLNITSYEVSNYETVVYFTSGATATTLTLPASLNNSRYSEFTIKANRRYTLIICNGFLSVGEANL